MWGLSTTCVCFQGLCDRSAIGKYVHDRKWLTGAKLSWVKGFKSDKHKTMCCVGNEEINTESMEESALKSYTKGEKHKKKRWNWI